MPSDALLASNDREEALSRAYVDAIAAGAGYTLSSQNFDRDGIDVQIQAGGQARPRIDVQLKATINLGQLMNVHYQYPLKRLNYELLRAETMVPRILIVLSLPKSENDWLDVTTERLIMRNCAFWTSLSNLPESANKDYVTISINGDNRFNVETLKTLMSQARTGKLK
jgi:hypothetical protein